MASAKNITTIHACCHRYLRALKSSGVGIADQCPHMTTYRIGFIDNAVEHLEARCHGDATMGNGNDDETKNAATQTVSCLA